MANKGFLTFDVVVVGAGASGIMAAITAARRGKSVAIIEHKDKPGKKLLATGNGKCNFTNEAMSKEYFRGDTSLIYFVLDEFTKDDTLSFFGELGIIPKCKNGYYYPNSESAVSILKALEMEMKRLGVRIYTSVVIKEIIKTDSQFDICVEGFKYVCDKLIIATGLLASPKLGSDGSIFPVVEGLGHSFTKLSPALCGLKCKGFNFVKASGVRCDAEISVWVDEERIISERGELQLADYGISGIPVFQVSRYASSAVMNDRKCEAHIDFFPESSKGKLLEQLKNVCDILDSQRTSLDLLNGFFNDKLSIAILGYASISEQKKIEQLTDNDICDLVNAIKNTIVTVDAPRDYEFAQVCAGGLKTEEIDINSLESKLVKNLYFAGEILDVDAICGGYNLQWAWASGFVAGRSASK